MNKPICTNCGSPADYVGMTKVEGCSNKTCIFRKRSYGWVHPDKPNEVLYLNPDGKEVPCFCISHSKTQSGMARTTMRCTGEVTRFLRRLVPSNPSYGDAKIITRENNLWKTT